MNKLTVEIPTVTKNVVLPACDAYTVPVCFGCIVRDRESVVHERREGERK